MRVRPASYEDLPAITTIYNASIRTTATWADRDQTLDERVAWFEARRAAGQPVLVADERVGASGDTRADVVGFAAYGPFRDTEQWPGYRFTVEHTVHVRDDAHGRGIGRALMNALLDAARASGLHVMVGAVDAANTGSIEFHRRLGFTEVGRLSEVGFKFGRRLDLVLLQRVV